MTRPRGARRAHLLAVALLALPLRAASDAGSAATAQAQLASLRAAAPHAGPYRPTWAPSLAGSPVEYLILTDTAMQAEFARLAAWKTAKGVPAVVRTLDDVAAAAVQGSDRAETIRNYIRDAYRLWGVRFVLLGGDVDVVPARTVSMRLLDFADPISELYYSCLDGTWNADGDAHFGEPPQGLDPGDNADFFSEVFLGRAPVSTPAEAALFVDKTLRHERPEGRDFQNRLLFLAEVLFPTDYNPAGPPPSADGALFAEEIAALRPPWMQVQRLYEAQHLWPGSTLLTRLAATQAIDAGHGTVLHIGHGYRYTLSAGDGSLDVGDAADFTNGARAGLFYMLNCTATAFDFESMAEALLLNPGGGATAVVGAAREAFPVTARTYQRAFFEQLYLLGERRVGVAMTRSRHRFLTPILPAVERWTQLVYTLLGDPDLPIWTRVLDLQVEGLPASLPVGTATLALTVRDDSGPLVGARLCFQKEGDEYRVARTDSQGVAVVTVQQRGSGSMQLTVTHDDHAPFTRSIPVTTAGAGFVVVAAGLRDDGGSGGVGNDDGRLDAGETATLRLPLRNAGGATRTGITASLASTEAAVQVRQGLSAYADLPAAAEGEALTPFEVHVDPTLPDGAVITLLLDVTHAGGSARHRVELLVHAARLRLVGARLVDERAGNGDGLQDANEEVDLFYTVENRGSGTAREVRLLLETAAVPLQILVDSVAVADIPPGERREASAALVVREPDVTQSRMADLRLAHFQNADGTFAVFDLRRPAPPSAPRFAAADSRDAIEVQWDPAPEGDRLGYAVYRADTETGPFLPIHADVLLNAACRDSGLEPSRRYFYRVTTLDGSFLESDPSPTAAASTNPPLLAGWPIDVGAFTASVPGVADIDGDGGLDVVAAANQLLVWDAAGIELRDADQNALTWGVFYGNREIFGSVTLAHVDRAPGREIVAVTWDPLARFVTVVNGQGQDLPGWPRPLVPAGAALNGAQVPPVVANLDDEDGPEILVAARDGRLYGWHADGSEIADGDGQPATQGVLLDTGSLFLRSAPAVADLDAARPGREIVLGSTDGKLYVLDAGGRPLPGWPRTAATTGAEFGSLFASGICVADLDRDGRLEMIFLESSGRLHALHLDGSELPGFPVAGIAALGNVVPSPALGDLQGDADLEIVVAGVDGRVHAFDARGAAILAAPIASGATSESSPLLGDLDGDGAIEILFGNENGLVHAWNLDGTAVPGFPLSLGAEIRATPSLDDVNLDGRCDLLVQTWEGKVALWDLGVPWVPELFPWSTHRGNIHRTGEFGFSLPTPVLLAALSGRYDAAGILLAWHGGGIRAGQSWRIRRAGPFAADPRGERDWRQDARIVGRVQGGGEQSFLDADVRAGGWYAYSIEVETAGTAVVAGEISVLAAAPAILHLDPALPNPFNPSTRLVFDVPALHGASAAVPVRLDVLDARGRRLVTLRHGLLAPGRHAVVWDGRDAGGRALPSGIYLARLQSGAATVTGKLTLLR